MDELVADAEVKRPTGLPEGNPVAAQLRSALLTAQNWDQLGALCAAADEFYRDGGLSRPQVEELAGLAVSIAGTAAQPAAGSANLLELTVSGWSPGYGDRCPSCGSAEHWHNHGARVCAVCHPHPGTAAVIARTAA